MSCPKRATTSFDGTVAFDETIERGDSPVPESKRKKRSIVAPFSPARTHIEPDALG